MNIDRIGEAELENLKEVLSYKFRSSKGSVMMKKFEDKFSERYGSKYAISFVNGTATMHAALEAMGIGPGDEVIVPPLTMSATTFAVLQANATPVFADVDEKTFQISAESISKVVTNKTKAIITVALFGLSPDMDAINKIARPRSIRVIEDNAECFLGEYKNKLVGTLADCASFSFQSSKHLTSGEGGIIITDDLDLAERIRKVQSLGYAGVGAQKGKISKSDIQDPEYSRHVTLGWNYRMSELCCAVALAQVERMDALVESRIQAAKIFSEAAKGFENIIQEQYTPSGYKNSYWTWVVKIVDPKISWYKFRDAFVGNGGDGVYAAWKLTYLEPMFENMNLLGRENFITPQRREEYKLGLCPVAESLQKRLVAFKTNYWNSEDAERQAVILRKTLRQLALES